MSLLRPDNRPRRVCCKSKRRCARGLTFIELVIAMALTSMLSVVLGGLMMAVQTAREHSEGLEEATAQGQVVLDRIEHMISHAGIYQNYGQPVTLGLAVVNHTWSSRKLPDVLVIWSGGRDGGMAENEVRIGLPLLNEIIIYAPDPYAPSQLVEISFPTDTAEIDFRDPAFESTILGLLFSWDAQKIPICDRLRVHRLSAEGQTNASVSAIRFKLESTPSDADLSGVSSGTADWVNLPWVQGIVSGDSGLRQATVQIEMQVKRRANVSDDTASKSVAIPFFAGTSYRYVYRP